MKANHTHATQFREDEGYAAGAESQEESKEEDHGGQWLGGSGHPPGQQGKLLIGILDDEGRHGALDDPVLEVLSRDVDFNRTLDAVCKRLATNEHPYYSWEDLKQDVTMKFGRWLWRYRYEASLKTVLTRIAWNQLIDMRRRPGEQSIPLGALLPDADDFELEVPAPRALADIEDSLQVQEWLGALSDDERALFTRHHLEGRSLADLARERGVSRQAVDKQWHRILAKLRPLVGVGE
jgi:RNA polymerase sigma factor (sigma-70 family)